MSQQGIILVFKYLTVYATISSMAFGLTLPSQVTNKPHIKPSSSTTEPGSGGALVTPSTSDSKDNNIGASTYRLINPSSKTTCILLKTDAVVDIKYRLYTLEEQADAFIPKTAKVTGDCREEDAATMIISWEDFDLTFNFAKTPGGERWYINKVELDVSTSFPKLHGIQAKGKQIKLYHNDMLIPTPVGRSYTCKEIDIDLQTDERDNPPPGLKGSLLFRLVQLQPFMYKGEEFESSFECKPQKSFRDETAPIAVGSTLAIAVLMTVTGYGIFRYFKVKNVQYNTME